MHNRINLLEQEERRALKRIEETRSKADKILQNRQETLDFQKELELVRQQNLESCRSKVRQRNESTDEQFDFMSGSVIRARRQMEQFKQQKFKEAKAIKKDLQQKLKRREQIELKNLESKKGIKNEIKCMETGLKSLYESVQQQKQVDARLLKASQIKEEILKITVKDSEARKLERKEDNIIKRLKETHALQQETLSQIQEVFQNSLDQSSFEKRSKMLRSCTTDSSKEIADQMIIETKKFGKATFIK